MDCNEVREKLADYLDEEALRDLCHAIEEHLSHCPDCRVEVDSVRKTIVLYQSDREIKTPLTVSARLESALAQEYRRSVSRVSSD